MSIINLEKSFNVACAMRNTNKAKLAEELKVTKVYLSNITKGKCGLSVSKLQDIVTMLDMKMSEFIALGEQ